MEANLNLFGQGFPGPEYTESGIERRAWTPREHVLWPVDFLHFE